MSNGKPIYLELYSKLRDDIINGVYRHGARLPSKRTLASDMGVSVITVQHAYEILCDEGYIVSSERSGYFVSYSDGDIFSSHSPAEDTNKNNATPDSMSTQFDEYHFPFSVYAKTARFILSEYGDAILRKTSGRGALFFRSAIADYLARGRNMHVSPEQIVIGSGAEYLYTLTVQLLGRDKVFATEDPSYEKIQSVYKANGVKCQALKLGSDGILTEELEKTCADVLHVSPYRSYPSGVTASVSKRYEYLRWADDGGRYLIEDDFESEFTVSTKVEDTVFSLDTSGNVIYMNTFSRTVSPSLRVAYMVLPEKLNSEFDEKMSFYSCTVPSFEQYLIAELLNNGSFERHINRVRRMKRKKLETQNGRL